MRTSNRVIMALGALFLIGVYLFPIWSINLNAPQYPEGIGLNIWINNVEGKDSNDLQNINGLNHYIGMKKITPDAIPELKVMPWIMAFLIASGLVVAATGKRKWILGWLGMFIVLALVGLTDFYIWEYNYGHDLNPHAPIKVPGMSYQPPLLGSKQLLNIHAISVPHIGFYFALVGMGLAGLAFWRDRKADQKEEETE